MPIPYGEQLFISEIEKKAKLKFPADYVLLLCIITWKGEERVHSQTEERNRRKYIQQNNKYGVGAVV